MWNNWVEKAKAMAADIDQQLNESVGIDSDPNKSNIQHDGNTSKSTTTLTALSATDVPDTSENDDVWNDDFDFGDEDDENKNDKQADDDEQNEPIENETDNDASLQEQISENSSVPRTTLSKEVPDMSVVTATETDKATSLELLPEPQLPVRSDPAEEKVPGASSLPESPDMLGQEYPSKFEAVMLSAANETPADAWHEDEGDNIDFDDVSNQQQEENQPLTTSDDPPSPPRVVEALSDASKMMFSTFGSSSAAPVAATDGGDAPDNELSTYQKEALKGTNIEKQDESNDTNENSSPIETGVGGLLSNFAHRAEGLAHRAEGGVVSLLTAATQLAAEEDERKEAERGSSTAQQDPVAITGETLSSPSITDSNEPFPMQEHIVGEERDDLPRRGLNKSASESNVVVVEKNEWETHDDLDITEHDKAQEDSISNINDDKPVQLDNNVKEEPIASTESLPDAPVIITEATSTNQSVMSTEFTEQVAVTSTLAASPRRADSSAEVSDSHVFGNIEDDPRYKQLQETLLLRENQLGSKAEQLNELQNLIETQEQEYKQKLQDTKEEAKKRIQRAKERCEAAEAKLRMGSSSGAEDAAKQEQIIKALREEGEALAMKQSAMEQAVRAAKGETRELREQLEDELNAKEQALEKIKKLEGELKSTKEELSAARKGESQVVKLENDLLAARSDAETKANTILSLQQNIKELTTESKDLKTEIEKIRKAAAHEAQQEKSTMRREHNDTISDLETKLRTTEREAGVREDALRHEVAELRKRWQDAVRRADALSMDIQSSTAPLLRQLESMERQNRARAANWAELEGRLRSDLEESVIQNESLSKDRLEYKAKVTRLERLVKERDDELAVSRRVIEEHTNKIDKLEKHLDKLEAEAEQRQKEYEKVERLASEGVARVRSEMSQTVMDSEERYRGQIDKLEAELRVEREKRDQLEKQVEDLLENAGMIMAPQTPQSIRRESKPKKLRESESQAEILAGALGLGHSDDDDDDDDDDFGELVLGMDESEDAGKNRRGSAHSFAALEQLTSRVKSAQVELTSLRSSLRESEKTRDSLVEELGETRHAKEKLPLFEEKVKQLTQENREMELEIMGLREDIAEVKELYRAQLNLLLEEKASNEQKQSNGGITAIADDGAASIIPEADEEVPS